MASLDFGDELELLLQARFTLVILITQEEARAMETVKKMCERSKRPLITWDLGKGFQLLTEGNETLPNAPSPIAALEQMEKMEQDALFVLKDFDDCWSNAQVKRQLRNLAQVFKQRRKSILVTSCSHKIPEQLKDDSFITEFPLPETQELEKVLSRISQVPGAKVQLTPLGKQKLLQAALGLSASQALRVFSKAVVKDGMLDDRHIDMVTEEKRQVIRESQALEFYPVTEKVDDIGGLDILKEWLRLRQRAFTQEAKDFMLPAPKGIALIGIPGTGKSLTAKIIGSFWQMPVLRLDAGSLFGSLVGESEERTRKALLLAETVAPCVLWVDEVEKAFSFGDNDGGTSRRVFGQILTWMQEKKKPCFVVATANDVKALPPEFMRRGRFDEIFFLDLPTFKERKEILSVHLRKRNRLAKDFDLDKLALQCEGFVGAEIEQAVLDGMYYAFDESREFSTADVEKALRRQVPLSVSQSDVVNELRKLLLDGKAQSASFREAKDAKQSFVELNLELPLRDR